MLDAACADANEEAMVLRLANEAGDTAEVDRAALRLVEIIRCATILARGMSEAQ